MKQQLGMVLIVAGLILPATHALGQLCTTSFADPVNPFCVEDAKCQKGIVAAAAGYVAAVQKAAADGLSKSQTAKFTTLPANSCAGGPRVGLSCGANNGVCKTGVVGKPCSANSECGIGTCDRTKGCNGPSSSSDDQFECQPKQTTLPVAAAAVTATDALIRAIFKACTRVTNGQLVDPNELGLTNIVSCPRIATPLSLPAQYRELADCITKSVGGDFANAVAIETTLFPFQNSMGTNSLPVKSPFGADPRMVLQFLGATELQVGSGVAGNTTNTIAAGGTVLPLALSHCSGGNGNVACVRDAHCGTDAVGAPGTCISNSDTTYQDLQGNSFTGRALTGAALVRNPADPASVGNALSVASSCANSVSLCTVTRARNAGNGTAARGAVNLTTGDWYSATPTATDIYVTGLGGDCSAADPCPLCINPSGRGGTCSGLCNATVTGTPRACQTPSDCPAGEICVGGGSVCLAADHRATAECLPIGAPIGPEPNPMELDTAPKTLHADASNVFCGFCDTDTSGACHTSAVKVCAKGCALDSSLPTFGDGACATQLGSSVCDNTATPATIGASCSGDADCGGVSGSCKAVRCNSSTAVAGFHGDPTVTQISVGGSASLYTPQLTGLQCTGVTGNMLVDNAFGLPGPVRSINPRLNLFVFGP